MTTGPVTGTADANRTDRDRVLLERHREHLVGVAERFAHKEPGASATRTAHVSIVRSGVRHLGGLFSMAVPHRGAAPDAVLADVRRIAHRDGEPILLWTHEGADTAVAIECWRHGVPLHSQLPVMVHRWGPIEDPTGGAGPTGRDGPTYRDGGSESIAPSRAPIVEVKTPQMAALIQGVHLEIEEGGPFTPQVIGHFYRDDVVFGGDVEVACIAENDVVAAVAMLVHAAGAPGLYWVATRPQFRRCGYAANLVSTLCHRTQHEGSDVVFLQATARGWPLYRRLGFADLGLATRWLVTGTAESRR